MKKMKIRGSETLDRPQGEIVTRKQAERIAKQRMPNDLKAAGFQSCVVETSRGWDLQYGKAIPSMKTSPLHA
jgi:hypothetical protein